MAATELQQMIDVVAKDKGIDPAIVIGAIEDAYLAASRKVFKSDEDLRTRFNLETGQVELYAVRQIVADVDEPGRARFRSARPSSSTAKKPKSGWKSSSRRKPRSSAASPRRPPSRSSRSACAKPSARRFTASSASASAKSSTPTVKRFESGDIIAEIGRVEAQIPRKEQSRAENYAIGDRVRAVIKAVTKNAKGPQVVLSRTDPALLIKLFEQEVPGDLRRHRDDPRRRPRGRRSRQGRRVLARARRRPGRRVRRHARHARAGDHPRAARREDRHRRVVRGSGAVRHQGALPRPRPARQHRRRRAARDGSGGRRSAAVARDRQEGPERPARGEADRLEDRHQERRREAEGSRSCSSPASTSAAAPRRPRPLALPDIHDEVVAALRAAGFDTVDKVLEAEPASAAGAARVRRRTRSTPCSRPPTAERRQRAATADGRRRGSDAASRRPDGGADETTS